MSGHTRARLELLTAGVFVRRLRQYRVFTLLAVRMAQRYHARSKFRGTFVLAQASLDPGTERLQPRFESWDSYIEGPRTNVEVADTHTGIMRRPRVIQLADALGPLLAEADAGRVAPGSVERAP